jgi:uncharacterized protein YjdB
VKNAAHSPNLVSRWIVLFATLALAAGCGGMKKSKLQTFTVSSSSQSLRVGTSMQLAANLTYEGPRAPLPKPTPAWSSSDASVASVNKDGLVTGIKAGAVTITGTLVDVSSKAERKGTIALTVTADKVLTSVAIDAVPAQPIGATVMMVARGTYNDGSSMVLTDAATWTSSDPTVATVGNGGTNMARLAP